MNRLLQFLGGGLLLFILLMFIGKLAGHGPVLSSHNYRGYVFSLEAKRAQPELRIPDEIWQDLKVGAATRHYRPEPVLFHPEVPLELVGTRESQVRLETWLDETLGRDHWRWRTEYSFKLSFWLGDRIIGVWRFKKWRPASTPDTRSGQPHLLSSEGGLTHLGYLPLTPDPFFFEGEHFVFEATSLVYLGRAWPAVLIFSLLSALLVYALYRPIWRAFTSWRRTKTTRDS